TDLAPWIELLAVRDLSAPMLAFLDRIPTLSQLIEIDHDFAKVLAKSAGPSTDADDKSWSNNVYSRLELGMDRAELMLAAIDKLAQQCILYSNYDYDFLYDSSQYLLAIGYNVDEHHKDHGNYDLLGSESRFGVFVAIAQNKIPQSSWFALGRQLTNPNGDTVLLSWSGSMFEYLMPMLVMPSFENTLLDHTHKAAVKSQIAQGINRGFPWGVSESGYNMIASNLDYQYRAFGVPGLGFKRGLSEDIVVAPYATIMALMVDPEESYANLRELQDRGYMGDWGYYEAIDYTPSRLPRGKSEVVIKSFMSHHQGMSMLSLAYLLLDQPMQRRFQSEPQFQATMLLLQEKIPQVNKFFLPNVDETDVKHEGEGPQMRVITTSNTPIPEVQLLSNGNYHVMVNNAGGGYSRWRDMAVTRWKEDSTCDNWGTFCYIKDLETNEYWSAAHQPSLRIADSYEVIFSQGRAEFRRKDNKFETHTEIIVSPEDDVEMRRTHITNRSRKTRTIEVTSYAEVVLNSAIGDALHPAFSNLFVQTKINHARDAILCTRRARAPEETPPWLFHLMKVHGATMVAVSYETSRDQFIGRGNQIHDPIVMTTARDLSGSEGPVLDPIVSIRYKITLEPQETVIVDMVYGISDQLDTCNVLIEKYQERHMIDRAFELAWTHSQVILRQINANEADAQLYGRLASSIIYANSALRAESAILIKNHRGQSGLWSYSVSGDLPIVLLQIEDNAQVDLVSQMVQARSYWKLKGLAVDLIIWNDDHGGYRQVLHNQILALIAPGMTKEGQEVPGGIFFRAADQITEEDRILFQTVARVIISDRLGSLEGQLNRRSRIKIFPPDFIPTRQPAQIAAGLTMPTDLKFNNGMGGYAEGGKEYVIYTSPTNITPAPWSNVIANPNFGTVISESGQSYTWIENAHELRLTPWNNDPVTDSGGEHFYLRDEESGTTWSPCPLPIRSASPYITRHGFGYSTFEHTEDGMHSMMQVFVDIEKSVKYTSIKLRNDNDRSRKISVTGYIEWVLGDLRYKSMMHVVTELELSTGAILARNSYSTEFEHRVAFFDVEAANKSITTDREEFFGRNGSVDNPEALRRTKLSGKTGAGFDPCAAIQVYLELASGEESELIFRLGAGANLNEASNLVKQTRGNITARNAFQAVKAFWGKTLSNLIISSPDPSFDILANGWLTYQTIACRIWARSGYYQSGGAFGFRDQLQDVMSLLQIEPGIARDQILLCASRQFVEGDVQHWWHPPMGRGVRTLCSDDYLWLPLVASKYVLFTGDQAVLDESIAYLEMRLLNANEHSVYDLPFKSQQSGTLYEHCVKAIEHGMRYGVHGLPLMGAGDWNDGMDRVGIEGKGESVWLAFFYFYVIKQFMRVAELRGDNEFILKYQQVSTDLQTNIEANAWDGKWYRRAYFDDGTPLGSSQNEECEIDSIAQSWSLISGAAKKDRSVQAMGQAGQRLIHRDGGFIQLFEPAFDKSDLNPGYIKGYVPGVRENGGQYTHAAIWMIMGFALMGDRERTSELISMINPINRSSSKDKVSVYKVEPYVIAADVYAIKEQLGRGGWTWYTGSAGWMYQLIVEHVIGIIREGNKLRLEPCLPVAWGQVEVQYKFASTLYVITLVASELASPIIIVDGAKQSGNEIQLVDDGIQHSVEFQY
ncbi:MAG: glucoamylase family protein, partial [Saprospiraceae bacterium]